MNLLRGLRVRRPRRVPGPGSASASLSWIGDERIAISGVDPEVTSEMEGGVLRTITRLNGTPFPSMARMASRWLLGRAPSGRRRVPATRLASW
jgi:hypothetical protein